MPTYNDALYIREAIDSILVQTFKSFELLVVIDGSTDATEEILASYADPRIKIFFHKTNQGRAAARNFALKNAAGEYLLWMDSDDIALPTRLEKQIAFMDAHPEIAVCGGALQCFHGSDVLMQWPENHEDIHVRLAKGSTIANPTACMRKSMLNDLLIYDLRFTQAEDYYFWICAILDFKWQAANLQDTLCLYRVRGHTGTENHRKDHRNALHGILDRLRIDATEEMLDAYTSLALFSKGSEEFSLLQYKDLVAVILAANKKAGIFPQKPLATFLQNRIFHITMSRNECSNFEKLGFYLKRQGLWTTVKKTTTWLYKICCGRFL